MFSSLQYYNISDQHVISYKYVSFDSTDISDTPSDLRMIVQFVNNTPDCRQGNANPILLLLLFSFVDDLCSAKYCQ